MIRKLAASAAVGLALAVAWAGTAQAGHNVPELTVGEPGECGTVTFSTAWPIAEHQVANTVLVVQAADEQHVAAVGESIEVGPFDTESATIRYRVWGGGERDYDVPPLDDLDALLAHLDAGGDVLDADAPGVAWLTLDVKGCAPEPSPTTPTGPECVDVNTADAEELTRLKHVDADRAAQIIDLRPFTGVDDLDRVDGLRAGGPRLAELVAGGDGFLPLCGIDTDDGGKGGALPATGTSLPTVAGVGAVLLFAGAGALALARVRRRAVPLD
jgi:hypothetical protein